jgi:hypothetical protein
MLLKIIDLDRRQAPKKAKRMFGPGIGCSFPDTLPLVHCRLTGSRPALVY